MHTWHSRYVPNLLRLRKNLIKANEHTLDIALTKYEYNLSQNLRRSRHKP
jgi:hypothetical protein